MTSDVEESEARVSGAETDLKHALGNRVGAVTTGSGADEMPEATQIGEDAKRCCRGIGPRSL